MRIIILLLIALSLVGCVRIITDKEADKFAQSYVDTLEAAEYIEDYADMFDIEPIKLASRSIREHGANMAKAMHVNTDELPEPRVSKNSWATDAKAAYSTSNENAVADSKILNNPAIVGLAALPLLAIGLKLGQILLKGHPLGAAFGVAGTLFGYDSPTKTAVHDKLIAVLEEYKSADPSWKDNKLFILLSDKLTQAEKDYIKVKRNDI